MKVDICICTYRRKILIDTLNSIKATIIPDDIELEIIIADNDLQPTANEIVTNFRKDNPNFYIKYIHAPKQNISIARNACLDASNTDYLIFLDDDETVSKNWLIELLKLKDNYTCVLGPVIGVYKDNAPKWLVENRMHDTEPVFVNGEIRTGYAGNVLIKRLNTPFSKLKFDLDYGKSGGEDTIYFSSAFQQGATIGFASKALVYETVTKDRENKQWLFNRAIRSGQTYSDLLKNKRNFKLIFEIVLAFSKFTYCILICLIFLFFNKPYSYRNYYRGVFHLGVLFGLLHKKDIKLYGD